MLLGGVGEVAFESLRSSGSIFTVGECGFAQDFGEVILQPVLVDLALEWIWIKSELYGSDLPRKSSCGTGESVSVSIAEGFRELLMLLGAKLVYVSRRNFDPFKLWKQLSEGEHWHDWQRPVQGLLPALWAIIGTFTSNHGTND